MPSKVKPEVESSDDEADQIQEPVVETKPKRTKKERTPAQQEAFKKALQVLKEKRESKAKEEKDKFEKATKEEQERITKEKYEKARNHRKKLPPAPSYITSAEFGASLERFKMDLLNAIPNAIPKPEPREEPKKKTTIVEPKEEAPPPVVKKVVEPKVQKQEVKLTGHSLLDHLFFNQ